MMMQPCTTNDQTNTNKSSVDNKNNDIDNITSKCTSTNNVSEYI